MKNILTAVVSVLFLLPKLNNPILQKEIDRQNSFDEREILSAKAPQSNVNEPYLSFDESPFDKSISIFIHTSAESQIVDCYFNNNSMIIIDDLTEVDDGLFTIELCLNDDMVEGFSDLIIVANDSSHNYSLYFIHTDLGAFLSQSSISECYDRYYLWLFRNGYIDIDEYCQCSKNHFNNSISTFEESDQLFFRHDPDQFEHRTTYIYGKIDWGSNRIQTSDGNYYPLCGSLVKFYLCREDDSFQQEIGETATDNHGNYSFHISESYNGLFYSNFFLRVAVFAKAGNAEVKASAIYSMFDSSLTPSTYYVYTDCYQINAGKKYKIDIRIDVDSSIVGHAFCVSQALHWGNRYVEKMSALGGVIPNRKLTCCYPGVANLEGPDEAFEIGVLFESFLSIGTYLYTSWDVILHEYGHYLQQCYDCADPDFIYGTHFFNENLIYKYSKSQATKLAWQEAWPTAFSVMATKYFIDREELDDITLLGLGNNSSDEYGSIDLNGLPIVDYSDNLEEDVYIKNEYGETCEGNITRFLFDLYDDSGSSESFDNTSIGHKNLWDLITKSHAHNLSEFINYVHEQNAIDEGELGTLLSHYHFAANNVSFDLNHNSPRLSWNPSNDWTNVNENTEKIISNKHFVRFFDSDMNYICDEEARFKENYLDVSTNVWTHICNAQGKKFYAQVYSYSIDPKTGTYESTPGFVVTGPYFTALYAFDKPNYYSGIVYLYPEDCINSNVSSYSNGVKTISLTEKTIKLTYTNALLAGENKISLMSYNPLDRASIKYHSDTGFYKFRINIFNIEQAYNPDSYEILIYCNNTFRRYLHDTINSNALLSSSNQISLFEYEFLDAVYDIELVVHNKFNDDVPIVLSVGNVSFDMFPTHEGRGYKEISHEKVNVDFPPYYQPIYSGGDWGIPPIFDRSH